MTNKIIIKYSKIFNLFNYCTKTASQNYLFGRIFDSV